MTVIDTDKFPFDDEDLDDFPLFTEEELRRTRAEIIANNPEGKNRILKIPRDENGKPIGYTLEEVFAGVDKILSEAYGVDFAKVSRMIESGELNDEDITEELLHGPEFEYKPYPGFKPKHVPENSRFTEEELNRMRTEILADNSEDEDIPLDENGNPIGSTLDEVFAGVDKMLSESYGVDFAKVSRMIESGELNDKDITNELLGRPEFEYKPYPGFKPKPIPGDFNHKPWLSDALSEDDELDEFPRFTEEELNRMRAEILANNPEGKNRILKIPRDENGKPIGYTWEETREMMYGILSGRVDLRTSRQNPAFISPALKRF